jgi:hypothetical protein
MVAACLAVLCWPATGTLEECDDATIDGGGG